ncbi:MAG: thioredoxin family protein [Aquificaceae bacterium]|nr:thioredoxin family protein [Aquificaceae bacterium]MDW8422918.1 thioredoxin family protein [Aquificaceae bacterium]
MLTVALAICQVLLFEQPGCASCKASYRELGGYPNLRVEVYDITKDRDLARSYKVLGSPTIIFLKNGEEIGRVYGYMPPLIKSLAEKCS